MAIITPSALITDIKGKIAGSVFQRSTGGIMMRVKPSAIGQGSKAQLQIRLINAELAFDWQALTDAQRLVWKTFADFCNGAGVTKNGRKSSSSGRAEFMSVNFYTKLYKVALLLEPKFVTPPPTSEPCPPENYSCIGLMDSDFILDTTKQILITKVSKPQGKTTTKHCSGTRTLVYAQVNGTLQDWSAAYELAYGTQLILNKKYWISLQVLDFTTGRFSPLSTKLLYYYAPVLAGIGFMAVGTSFIVG